MEQLSSPTLFLFVMWIPLKGPRKGPLKSLPRNHLPAYLSWLENPVHTRSVIGSNPIAGTSKTVQVERPGRFLFIGLRRWR